MAKPVTFLPTPRGEREELVRKLGEAPATHAAALLDLYQLAQVMHDRGTLDLLRGLTGAGDDILGRLSAGLSKPESIQAMRDFIELTKLFAKLDPDRLRTAMEEGEGLLTRAAREETPPGIWAIMRRMSSPDARRALGVIAEALNSLGRGLAPRDKSSRDGSGGKRAA